MSERVDKIPLRLTRAWNFPSKHVKPQRHAIQRTAARQQGRYPLQVGRDTLQNLQKTSIAHGSYLCPLLIAPLYCPLKYPAR